MSKSLAEIVHDAALRFDGQPEYRASIEARAELRQHKEPAMASDLSEAELRGSDCHRPGSDAARMVAEIRRRRALDLTAEECEALRWARDAIEGEVGYHPSMDVLVKLIATHGGGQ